MQPTCGRIVLVMVPGTEIVRPAIVITATNEEITAHVFGMSHTLDQGGFVGKFTRDTTDARGEPALTPGTWHWPPDEPEHVMAPAIGTSLQGAPLEGTSAPRGVIGKSYG